MPNLEMFQQKLVNSLNANLSAKELAQIIVVAALESEYGRNFTLSPGFAKMVSTFSDAIVTNPDLRRQALAVASAHLKKNYDHQKSFS